jgi:hypothetical protein
MEYRPKNAVILLDEYNTKGRPCMGRIGQGRKQIT